MGLFSLWSNITGPRVREIAPPKHRGHANVHDRRPATSSGVRTIRKTPSLDEDDDAGRDLSQAESLLTRNLIEPPPVSSKPSLQEKKTRRRSRGLSLSKSKSDDGAKKRRSLFGGNKEATKSEEVVPDVPTLPTLSAIYAHQAPHQLHHDPERPSTAVSVLASPTSPAIRSPHDAPAVRAAPAHATSEVFELAADSSTAVEPVAPKPVAAPDASVKKNRRRSVGEILSGKRSKSLGTADFTQKITSSDAPATPPLPWGPVASAESKSCEMTKKSNDTRSRRNSNASVASRASKTSRKSRRKSWFQRAKSKEEDAAALPPIPAALQAQIRSSNYKTRETPSPDNIDLSAFPAVPAATKRTKTTDDDDAASIRTTRSEKAIARMKPQRNKSTKQRPVSTASHVRRKRRSWWTSSNPDDSDDDSNPLPPIPLLVRSNRTTPDSSPTTSETGGPRAPRPTSMSQNPRGGYMPRSAAKSFLVSTTPVEDSVRRSVRHSLHAGDGSEGADHRATYCLSAEQQREWEKLKHLMATLERRRDVTRQTFGEDSVTDVFPRVPDGTEVGGVSIQGRSRSKGDDDGWEEERRGVKYSNRDALAALDVGVAR